MLFHFTRLMNSDCSPRERTFPEVFHSRLWKQPWRRIIRIWETSLLSSNAFPVFWKTRRAWRQTILATVGDVVRLASLGRSLRRARTFTKIFHFRLWKQSWRKIIRIWKTSLFSSNAFAVFWRRGVQDGRKRAHFSAFLEITDSAILHEVLN